jgi:hypothetical protein
MSLVDFFLIIGPRPGLCSSSGCVSVGIWGGEAERSLAGVEVLVFEEVSSAFGVLGL